MIVYSLQSTPELEWEIVNYDKPETWASYEEELREAGFSEIEIGRVVMGVMRANSLDESLIDEARNSFLHGQGEVEM